MRFLGIFVALSAFLCGSHAFSFNGKSMSIADSKMLTQREVTRMNTRRDTIMMPSQTPMVPWKVGCVQISLVETRYKFQDLV